MALNIPLPGVMGDTFGKSIDAGGALLTHIMHPILEREKQRQLEAHFQEQLKLSKAAAGRAASARADAHKLALMKMDPLYEYKQFQALQNMLTGNNPNQGNQLPSQETPPSEEMGQGMGMFSPEGLEQAQLQPPPAPKVQNNNAGGFNADLLKQNPLLRGFFKKKFGFDPLAPAAQTPEDKQQMALDLFKQKEQIKTANKTSSGETLTAPIKTKYQNVIGGVTSARPILEKLIAETKKGNIPGQMIGSLFKRDAQASYKGEISTLLDGVRNAYTIPNTDSGTSKAEDKVLRKSGESDRNYVKRLEGILAQMNSREKDARTKLSAGNITANAANSVHLVGPNGEDYDVPESEVNAILKENPGVRRG